MGNRRYQNTFEKAELKASDEELRLDEESVVLAVGGARGITASVCTQIAKESGCRFIVLGKSPLSNSVENPDQQPVTFEDARQALIDDCKNKGKRIIPAEIERAAWNRVWESERVLNMAKLAEHGAEALYRQCDITRQEEIEKLVREIWDSYGRLDLVLQGGGVLVERLSLIHI